MLQHTRAVGDTLTRFAVTLQSEGTARDLSGKSVKFQMYTLAGVLVTNASAIIDGVLTGQVSYDFAANDVAVAGTYKGWFVISDSTPEVEHYPDNDDGIEITIFAQNADSTPGTPTIDIIALANAPGRTRTVEGTIEERSVNELVKADQYTAGKAAADSVPWGIRIARTRPGGMTT